uniref:Uncharacterized protein n=1 Tax=Bionectria ochroleuca TaxID=29856 RepID=A0A8H7TQD4_BIOOC
MVASVHGALFAVTNTEQFHQAEKIASRIRNVLFFPSRKRANAVEDSRSPRLTNPELTKASVAPYRRPSQEQVVGQEQAQLLVTRLRRKYRERTRANCYRMTRLFIIWLF